MSPDVKSPGQTMHSRVIQPAAPSPAAPTVTRIDASRPGHPAWIDCWLEADGTAAHRTEGDDWKLIQSKHWTFARCWQRDSGAGGEAFERSITALYARLHALLRNSPAADPVRFWNYVPRIHAHHTPDCDRYMSFNAGRHRAFEGWFRTSAFQPRIVAASAVGHSGSDVIVEALCGTHPPTPIENPRQRPAYRYSERYGKIPPSFARGSVVSAGGSRALITAGTASVVGEDSKHIDDLPAQLREIELNLAALIEESSKHGTAPTVAPATSACDGLKQYRHLRAYIVRSKDEPAVVRWIQEKFPALESVELMHADLCRRVLLVEVEGVAVLP